MCLGQKIRVCHQLQGEENAVGQIAREATLGVQKGDFLHDTEKALLSGFQQRPSSGTARPRSGSGPSHAPMRALEPQGNEAMRAKLQEKLEAVQKVTLAKELQQALAVTQKVTAQLYEQLEAVEKAVMPMKQRPQSAGKLRSSGSAQPQSPALTHQSSAGMQRPSSAAATPGQTRSRPQSAGAARTPVHSASRTPPAALLQSSTPTLSQTAERPQSVALEMPGSSPAFSQSRVQSAGRRPSVGSALRCGSAPEELASVHRHREMRLHGGTAKGSAWQEIDSRLQALERHHMIPIPSQKTELRLPTPA